MKRTKLALEGEVDVEVIRIAHGVRRSHHEAILIYYAERESRAVLHEVLGVGVAHQKTQPLGQQIPGKRRPSPGVEPVGGVPRVRAGRLRSKDGVLETVIDGRIG